MSLNTYRGAAWLFQRWMQAAQRDLEHGGEIKPARRIWTTARRFWVTRLRRRA
jgi:hypothetical protein